MKNKICKRTDKEIRDKISELVKDDDNFISDNYGSESADNGIYEIYYSEYMTETTLTEFVKWTSDNNDELSYSSSWDHFFMDGDDIECIYVDHSNDNKIITDFSMLSMMDMNKLFQYPVPKGKIKSFEDLKKYYENNK